MGKDEGTGRKGGDLDVEMWPYIASAAVASASHVATACFIFQLTMTLPVRETSQSPALVSHIKPQFVDDRSARLLFGTLGRTRRGKIR